MAKAKQRPNTTADGQLACAFGEPWLGPHPQCTAWAATAAARATRRTGVPMSDHTHTCQRCGHPWAGIETQKRCGTCRAAKINGEGPFCELCLHVEMARRHAELRGIDLSVTPWPPVREQEVTGGE